MKRKIEIQEEVKIDQGDQIIVLEKGDKIEVLKEEETQVTIEEMIEDLEGVKEVEIEYQNGSGLLKGVQYFSLEFYTARMYQGNLVIASKQHQDFFLDPKNIQSITKTIIGSSLYFDIKGTKGEVFLMRAGKR